MKRICSEHPTVCQCSSEGYIGGNFFSTIFSKGQNILLKNSTSNEILKSVECLANLVTDSCVCQMLSIGKDPVGRLLSEKPVFVVVIAPSAWIYD